MATWIKGDNGNRASVEFWSSEEAAKKSMETCSRCSRCSGLAPQQVEQPAIPVIPNIHQAVYVAATREGALCMETWHTCEKKHCRAGWVIHLAEPAGYELERRTDPVFAAMRIYEASGYEISPVRFFDEDEAALPDMKRLAETEPELVATYWKGQSPMIPQLIIIAMSFAGLGLALAKHGQDQGKFNVVTSLIATSIQFGLLYWGGFFDCFFGGAQ